MTKAVDQTEMAVLNYTILLLVVVLLAQAQDDGIENRIVGGEDANDAAYPYQISLQLTEQHICGGAIIGNQSVLTAAHCVRNAMKNLAQYSIVAGTNSLDGTGQRYQISKVILNPGYTSSMSAADIAVIILSKTISFSNRVKTISLTNSDTPEGRQLTLTGWGKTSYPGQVSRTLKTIKLTSISNKECRNSFPSISSGNLCTKGDAGKGACQGDSGGPLTENGAVVGVLSYGVPCAIGSPDVFARVYSFNTWIRSNMR